MKKNIKLMIILMSVVLLTGCSFFNNDELEEQNKNQKPEKMDINNVLVQELYNNIVVENVVSKRLIDLIRENGKVLVENIDDDLKNYFGYRQLAVRNIKFDMCRNYPSIINKDIKKTIFGCGEKYSDKISDYDYVSTHYIEEKVLKKAVEDIFGPGTYQKTDYFAIYFADGYSYDDNTNRYVYGTLPSGGPGPFPTITLVSAEKTNDSIKIIENVKIEQNEYNSIEQDMLYNINIEYTFKLVDGNYYFHSAEKQN